jgi:hypothetical protein
MKVISDPKYLKLLATCPHKILTTTCQIWTMEMKNLALVTSMPGRGKGTATKETKRTTLRRNAASLIPSPVLDKWHGKIVKMLKQAHRLTKGNIKKLWKKRMKKKMKKT